MAMVINTNTLSLQTQQNLNKSQSQLNSAIEKLSSGSRINSAKDDAAGQAIANRMSSQITGLNQASRNANDGISLAQTAEGALDQVNDNLQRIRELSVQASNGTNSAEDLDSIQDEITQRLSEIDRVSGQTNFNGTKVLDSDQGLSIQVGANDGETISVNLKEINSQTLGLTGFDATNFAKTVEATNVAGASEDAKFSFDDTSSSVTGGTVFEAKDGSFYLQADDGNVYSATVTPTDTDNDDADADTTTGTLEDVVVAFDSASPLDANAQKAAGMNALGALDDALSTVDNLRSDLGAVQNRFDSAIENINTTSTNLSSARSRIEDADYATEVSNMSKAQILQQAGTSVLAQANQTTQGVLSLLG
ncbi:FliC/FljB family flagellin [Larsenimonas salina]|uniref:FliC/FljB family flagellin n=1 Tax=Larsenimonas salina TaxID=1295565 RepID=UPI0020746390|nr:FliC/FljB family flagellin [Larsenimonas salina]MCM5703706.1 FliC/FljB family flagellin [Larsenimonas salina]